METDVDVAVVSELPAVLLVDIVWTLLNIAHAAENKQTSTVVLAVSPSALSTFGTIYLLMMLISRQLVVLSVKLMEWVLLIAVRCFYVMCNCICTSFVGLFW